MESNDHFGITYSNATDAVITTRPNGYGAGVEITYIPISENRWSKITEWYDYAGRTVSSKKEEMHSILVPAHIKNFRQEERERLGLDSKSGLMQKLSGFFA